MNNKMMTSAIELAKKRLANAEAILAKAKISEARSKARAKELANSPDGNKIIDQAKVHLIEAETRANFALTRLNEAKQHMVKIDGQEALKAAKVAYAERYREYSIAEVEVTKASYALLSFTGVADCDDTFYPETSCAQRGVEEAKEIYQKLLAK